MVKDPFILGALRHLEETLGAGAFVVKDCWEADLRAVGVINPANPGALAYNALDASKQFSVTIEIISQPGSELPYKEIGRFECGDDLDGMSWVVQDFLAIKPKNHNR